MRYRSRKSDKRFDAKIVIGFLLLGLGTTSVVAFPKEVKSLQMPDEHLEFLQPDPIQAQILYEGQQYTKKAEKLVGTHQGQCVVAVRKFLGVGRDQVPSLAKNTQINTDTPQVGEIIKTKESWAGHVGVVIGVSNTTVIIFESNVPLGSERAEIRTLQINDPRIAGYREI